MYKKFILAFLCVLPTLCMAEFKDPTKPDYLSPGTVSSSDTKPVLDTLALYAVWITARTRWANINGVIAKQGQTILSNVKIMRINRNSVYLNQNGELKTLSLIRNNKKSK
jgi:hypothetical protein